MPVLTIEWHDRVAHVVLSRPHRLNALDAALIDALVDAGRMLATRRDCRAVVLSGAGRGFCAGIDLRALQAATTGGTRSIDIVTEVADGANIAQQAVLQWRALPVPVIAAIHGAAFGGGLQLALGADLRVVAPDARLALAEVKWGLVPDMAGMALLPGLVREDVLADLVFSGRTIDGTEAVAIGLATRTATNPVAVALERAQAIAGMSPDAVRAAKRLLRIRGDRAAVLRAESHEQMALFGRPHQREAAAAALAGRTPVFQDEEQS